MKKTASASAEWHALPLHGLNLIEADAGTGKTHMICYLYLRLLLEQKFDLEKQRILVVTFTQAAAAELRLRIRQLLVDALRLLQHDGEVLETERGVIRLSACPR